MTKEKKPGRVRLVDRRIAEGETQIEALAVARADCEGFVDGVHVDFRHPGLPPGEWEAREFWHVGANSEAHCGFLFPTEGAWCDANPEQVREELLHEKLTLPRAAPGDRLAVESVVDRISDRRFDHLDDSVVKEAHLVLTRPNGEMIRPARSLLFYGVTQLRDGPSRDAYDRLVERVLAQFGGADPHSFGVQRLLRPIGQAWKATSDFPLSERAALAIEKAEQAWLKLDRNFLKGDAEAHVLLRRALSGAVLAAFFQAKHELREAERLGSGVKENLAEGPAKLRNQHWWAAADRHWQGNPNWRRNRVITEMINTGEAEEFERRSILRSLKKHPRCPA